MIAWAASDDTGATAGLVAPDPMWGETDPNWFAEITIGVDSAVAVTREDVTALRDACNLLLGEEAAA